MMRIPENLGRRTSLISRNLLVNTFPPFHTLFRILIVMENHELHTLFRRAKAITGKRAFEAMGRRAASAGLPLLQGRMERLGWPMWARSAYARGWIQQPSPEQLTDILVNGFVVRSVRDGVSLCATVDRFLEEMREQQ
ncbi:hypothetical protein [Paraburkholderia saeva]|uniref:hypothetical protein n=1 Tax=Paraburkholderia saeva TaxID=2777537 RepID=UPI001E64CAC3|nr:hypothetical protein [Paraburkholderia saeva]